MWYKFSIKRFIIQACFWRKIISNHKEIVNYFFEHWVRIANYHYIRI